MKQHVELPGSIADEGEPLSQTTLGEHAQQRPFGGDAVLPVQSDLQILVVSCAPSTFVEVLPGRRVGGNDDLAAGPSGSRVR